MVELVKLSDVSHHKSHKYNNTLSSSLEKKEPFDSEISIICYRT